MTAPDLTTYRLIHRLLREGARRLATGVSELDLADRHQIRAFATYWHGYAGELLHHHTVEDVVVFPALEAQAPAGAAALAAVDGDHHHMDVLMTEIGREVARVTRGRGPSRLEALLWELSDHLDEHLDVEDDVLLPLIERHFSAAEYVVLERRIEKEVNLGTQALFTVPFVMAGATEAEGAALLAQAPAALRLIHRITQRKHARLCATAFPRTPAPRLALPGATPSSEQDLDRELAVA